MFAQEGPKKPTPIPAKNQTIKSENNTEINESITKVTVPKNASKDKDTLKMKSVLEGKVKYRAKNMLSLIKRKS